MGAFKIKLAGGWLVINGSSVSVEAGETGFDAVPANPSALDDEFPAGEALNVKWTPMMAVNPETLYEQTGGGARLRAIGGGNYVYGFWQLAPVGEFTATLKLFYPVLATAYQGLGIYAFNDVETQGRSINSTTQGDGQPYHYVFRMNKVTLAWEGDFVGQNYYPHRPGFLYLRLKRYLHNGVLRVRTQVSTNGYEWASSWDGLETDFMPNGITKIGVNFGTPPLSLPQGGALVDASRGSQAIKFFRVTTP